MLPTEDDFIRQIADWYKDEWNTPLSRTINRLKGLPDDLIFHLVLTKGGHLIATGGVYQMANIFGTNPQLSDLQPWLGMLYTAKGSRGMGFGDTLLKAIEKTALDSQLEQLYLYTNTAQRLYERNGWKVIDWVQYRGEETAVMHKTL